MGNSLSYSIDYDNFNDVNSCSSNTYELSFIFVLSVLLLIDNNLLI